MVAFGPNKGDRVETPVYERTALVPGTSFTGPAIVEQNDFNSHRSAQTHRAGG